MASDDISKHYDKFYSGSNSFGHRQWVYRPLIREVVRRAQLQKGSRVLDVGCGQGFFSKLLVDEGMKVEGVDASQEGINSAQRYCAKATFFVGDAFGVARERAPFQAVFCRAFSPYNTSDLARQRATTDRLLEVLIPGGILIWLYNSRLRPAEGQSWRQHSLTEAQHQFEPYNASVFVSLRVETSFVGLGRWQTALNEFLVKHSPLGGELVVLVKKPGG